MANLGNIGVDSTPPQGGTATPPTVSIHTSSLVPSSNSTFGTAVPPCFALNRFSRPCFDFTTRSNNVNEAHEVFVIAGTRPVDRVRLSAQPTRLRLRKNISDVSFVVHDSQDTLRSEVWGPYDLTAQPPLSLTGSFASGTVDTAYSSSLTAAGISGAATWTYTGTLPTGLSLDQNTLSGTPTAAGTYKFTVMVVDSFDGAIAYRDCSVVIS